METLSQSTQKLQGETQLQKTSKKSFDNQTRNETHDDTHHNNEYDV